LVCAECSVTPTGPVQGWKAELGEDPREDDGPEVVILCPGCWEREFGDLEHAIA
jgi:hypothetical protein